MHFVIRRNDDGRYWWRFVGDNKEIIAASDLMNTKEECRRSIEKMRAGVPSAPVRERSQERTARHAV